MLIAVQASNGTDPNHQIIVRYGNTYELKTVSEVIGLLNNQDRYIVNTHFTKEFKNNAFYTDDGVNLASNGVTKTEIGYISSLNIKKK